MDICKELLIKKKWEMGESLFALLIVIGFPIAYFIVYFLLAFMGLRILGFLAFAGLLYVAYLLFVRVSREFEYTFVNGSLSIDVIFSQKKRKRLFSCEVKDIIYLGKYDVSKYEGKSFDKRIFAGESVKSDALVCVEIEDEDSGKVLLIFSPTKEYLENMKPFIKPSVYREAIKQLY